MHSSLGIWGAGHVGRRRGCGLMGPLLLGGVGRGHRCGWVRLIRP